MKITNAFDVAAPLDVVWPILNDVPRVARYIPRAVVDDEAGAEAYRVTVPVRFGFFTISYAASIVVVRRDDATYSAELEIEGNQLVGGGKVRAHVAISARRDGDRTHVDLETDAELGGFVGTVGKPIVDSVARRTVAEFAKKLESNI